MVAGAHRAYQSTTTPMNNISLRLTAFCCVLFVFLSRAASQVVLTIDYSNLSAVKFTATGNASAINYGPGAWQFDEGVALLNFLSTPATVVDLDLVGATPTSNLTDSQNILTASTKFNRLSSWNDAHPEYYPGGGTGVDLTLWNNNNTTDMVFSTLSNAFHGEAIFDLSSYGTFTSLFPALNATGNVVIWNGNGTLGTWQVVGVAAIPEPSTYAAWFGVVALAGAAALRRKRSVG
jgi:MYXO-CTERM domain-containing protein